MSELNVGLKEGSVFGLVGAGGFGRELMSVKKNFDLINFAGETIQVNKEVFIDEKYEGEELNGVSVFSESSYLNSSFSDKYFNVALADSESRKLISIRLRASNALPLSLISKNSIFHESSILGMGSVLCRSSIVTSNSIIGDFFHANIFAYVAHDCVIGDFVTFAPRVNCNGNVIIGSHAYLGTGATIKQGTKAHPLYIGKSSIIGMGSVVTKDVPDYAVVVGNPARIIRYTNG